jgi:hypothetical protein
MFQQSFTKNTALPYYTYDQRGLLRNWSPQDGAQALVDSLGLFVYSNSNSQILDNNNVNTYQAMDDDESCFLTGNGAWLLEYPHWDLVNNWQLPDFEALYAASYSNGAMKTPGRLLFASAGGSLNSLSAISQSTQNISVPGAATGDAVFVSPSNSLDASGRISIFASVTAANVVTVYYNNASAAAANWTTATVRVVVIKSS